MPAFRCSSSVTSSRKPTASKLGRGSRPGFSSSATMSRSVGSPRRSSTYLRDVDAADQVARCRPGRVDRRPRGRPPCARRRRSARGARRCASSGFVGAADAQEAGRLLEGLGAEPRHLEQLARATRRGRGRRGARRCSWRASGRCPRRRRAAWPRRCSPRRRPRSRTTRRRRRAALPSRAWLTSCWYCPTPIDLGSIFTSSASGSCRRRPMETAPRTVTSWSGNSSRATSEAE